MFIEEKTKEQGRFDILLRDNDRLDANLQKGINAFGAVKSELVKLQLEIETLKKENNSLIIENSKLKATLNKRIVYKDIEEEQDI